MPSAYYHGTCTIKSTQFSLKGDYAHENCTIIVLFHGDVQNIIKTICRQIL
eukprot:TRINITY_DN6505_c0_g1_i1.p1 TRINITY_DN6505_c0_g1~~TRINITY_DN6505_c0_g1_i1.p1  ORF type:complete len:51 (-),score=3.97 TRINITY_DN6505_c0_g1_i1:189-341(-)